MRASIVPRGTLVSRNSEWVPWAPVVVGVLVLYTPVYLLLADRLWGSAEYAHGPIILLVCLWMLWTRRNALIKPVPQPRPYLGGALLVFGLAIYVLGYSQGILILAVGSQLPVFAGLILALAGTNAVKKLSPFLLFLAFVVPLPGFLMEMMTGTLKQQVSIIVENLLYATGYPIGRSGVTLTVGQYQLLVADACSGLNTMYSLTAIGLVYIFLMSHTRKVRNAILVAAILPIAFFANVLRVIMLVLITYYFGDAAGQGFVHSFAGLVLFIVSIAVLFGLDATLGRVFPDRTRTPENARS